jgi:hypothetical protein
MDELVRFDVERELGGRTRRCLDPARLARAQVDDLGREARGSEEDRRSRERPEAPSSP